MSNLAPYDASPLQDDLIGLRRDLHRHPELGFAEQRTAHVLRERMERLGLPVREVAGTGLIATLRGSKPGPTVLMRAELDALPIEEASEVSYRSVNPGVMHACGHDAHCAVAAVVAARFADEQSELRGTIKFGFQPAEEIASGASRMIEDGALEDPRVDAVLSLHVWQSLPVGTVAVAKGTLWAAVDDLTFTVHGAPGHGAMPHQGIDAIVAAAQIVTALQTAITRSRPPLAPAVLSIGTIHGGTTWNIIADRVEMRGTLRTFDPAVREQLLAHIRAIATGIAAALGASCEVEDHYSAPPVVNHDGLSQIVAGALATAVGEERVAIAEPALVGDDFAHFAQQVPGCLFQVGSSNPAKGLDRGHHDSRFDIDEDCLAIAAASLDSVIRGVLAGV